ncbi:hypothetical protein SELMODRAFT_147481 [Selaginella moellendorffii]|uniref:CHCH domain-containing protein n=1 Tax=Selaginella moellendorffii TaxID=88036 RepID=D8RIR6_SELML|nr:uncharacterized protein C6C3.02c [Selaginella moellendorffii]XP_024540458.1 uncharacterized protein C6C3.02c [Selaginella moellendorffii]EFJ27794.1 hypothetical protein SELMODRAFT_147481 [Selaginella moellendorffii]|eukprot:XP_002971196.1 uncharacterized protein C6C3.02c [Selaginella moellendorffii]
MPRSRGGARPAPRAPARRAAPPPQPVHHAPAPPPAPLQAGGGGMMGGLAGTIAQGMAFGTGSAIAHRAVDGVMGPRTVQHEVAESAASPASPALATVSADACSNQMKAFQDCISSNGSDIGRCQFYVDMLNECRRAPSSSSVML